MINYKLFKQKFKINWNSIILADFKTLDNEMIRYLNPSMSELEDEHDHKDVYLLYILENNFIKDFEKRFTTNNCANGKCNTL